jgi:hypothetical protein
VCVLVSNVVIPCVHLEVLRDKHFLLC